MEDQLRARRLRSNSDVLETVGKIFADYTSGRSQSQSGNTPSQQGDGERDGVRVQVELRNLEIERVQALWQQAKQELQRKTREIQELRSALKSSASSSTSSLASSSFSSAPFQIPHSTKNHSYLHDDEMKELHRKSEEEVCDLRDELRQKDAELMDLRESLRDAHGSLRNKKLDSMEVKHLKDRLRVKTEQLEAARAENDRWSQSYDSLRSELELVREMQNHARATASQEEERILTLERRCTELSEEKDRLVKELSITNRSALDESNVLKKRCDEASEMIRTLKSQLQDQTAKSRALERRLEDTNAKLAQQDMLSKELEAKVQLQERELENDARVTSRLYLKESQVRIEHLRVDNTRLLRLLKSTKEYKDFCEALVDVGDPQGSSYFPPAGSYIPSGHLAFEEESISQESNAKTSLFKKSKDAHRSCHEQCKSPKGNSSSSSSTGRGWTTNRREEILALDHEYNTERTGLLRGDSRPNQRMSVYEAENWMPQRAMEIGATFRKKFVPHVSMDVIRDLLRELNRAWQAHMAKCTAKMRDKHKKEVRELKRRARQSAPYEEVIQRSRINRLEQNLRSLRSQVGTGSNHQQQSTSSFRSSKSSGDPGVTSLFERTMEDTSHLSLASCLAELEEVSLRLRQVQDENVKLKLELEKQHGVESQLALECLYSETSDLSKRIKLRMRECMKRVSNLSVQGQGEDYINLVMRSYSAMMEDLEDLVDALQERLRTTLPRTPSQELVPVKPPSSPSVSSHYTSLSGAPSLRMGDL